MLLNLRCRIENPDIPRASWDEAGRSGAGRGVSGRGASGRRRVCSPRKQSIHLPPKELKTCRIQNPDIPRVGRGGAAHGKAAHGGATELDGAEQDGTSTGRFAQETTVPLAFQGIEDNCPERLFGSTNKRNPIVNQYVGGQNVWLTSGLSAGPRPLFVSGR